MAEETGSALLGIHTMAIAATVIGLAILLPLILIRSERRDWGICLVGFLLMLPAAWLLMDPVRAPLAQWIRELEISRHVRLFLLSLTAPAIEEPVKLLPLLLTLLPVVLFVRPNRANAVRIGLALGAGFGVGEVWVLAERVAQTPAAAKLPWTMFIPFLIERVPVIFLHGAFVAVTLWFWARGRWWGIFVAMALHYLLNSIIFLKILGLFGGDQRLFLQISQLWIYGITTAMAVLITRWLFWGRTAGSEDAAAKPPCAPQ